MIPKRKILLFFAIEPRIEVTNDFSVSLTLISFSDANRFISDGKSRNVTSKEIINPRVIIHPKSIIGFIPLKIKDKNAQIVVRAV